MGSYFSRIFSKLFGRNQMRILVIGLENAGKTTFLYQLLFKKQIESIPTIGFNIESLNYQNVNLQIWDLAGQKTFRQNWKSYFPNTQGVIFIIDSSDMARLDLAKEELFSVIKEQELKSVPLLILANKQDLPEALSAEQISDFLNTKNFKQPVKVFPTTSKSIKDSEGPLTWLVQTMANS